MTAALLPRKPPALSADAPLWRLGGGAPPEGGFVALAPGAEVAVLSLTLPATLTGPARRAVARRQVQDRLGPGFALRPLGAGDFAQALVAPEAALTRWRAALGGAAARCVLVPDYLALPWVPGGWAVSVEGGAVRVRLGRTDGFTAEPALAAVMLDRALTRLRAEGRPLPSLLRMGGAEGGIDTLLAPLPAAAGGTFAIADALGADLLREDADEAAPPPLRAWAPVVALVLAGALGWTLAQAIALRADRAEAAAIEANVLQAARRDLIPSGPIVDLRAQVERALQAQGAGPGTDVLTPLRRAAPALAGAEILSAAVGPEGTAVDLILPDFAALDALIADLGAAGVAVQVARSGLGDGGITASLLLGAVP